MKRSETLEVTRLPLLANRGPNLESCTFCPKLCRAACPVSNTDGRETTTPWGKMSGAYLLSHGAVPADVSQAAPSWACTGCLGCRSSCDLKNDVAGTLSDARADLFALGLAPEAAVRVAKQHKTRVADSNRGLMLAIERAVARGATIATANDPAYAKATPVVVGCLPCRASATDFASADKERSDEASKDGMQPEDPAADMLVATSILAKLSGAPAIRVVEGCCGAPLLHAGDRPGFEQARNAHAKAVGSGEVIVADAGCAFTMASHPSNGGEANVVHLSELARRHIAAIPPLSHSARLRAGGSDETVRYHDACGLGRGLGVYDAPRQVLSRLFGRPPEEFFRNRDRAVCSGGGGLLPMTAPETASAIALARTVEHHTSGNGAIVTSCTASRRSFARVGGASLDIATLVAWAFEG